jgi:hypothetical protein
LSKKKGGEAVTTGIIYKATNRLNGKVYIGQTTSTLDERKKQHVFTAFSPNTQKYPFQKAIVKYGEASFDWVVIDTGDTLDELNEKEIKWILLVESYSNPKKGYNRTPGGNVFPDEDRAVLHYDYKGNFISEYTRSYDAYKSLKIDGRGIRRCCQRRCRMYQGNIFLYKDLYSNEIEAKREVNARIKELQHQISSFYITA